MIVVSTIHACAKSKPASIIRSLCLSVLFESEIDGVPAVLKFWEHLKLSGSSKLQAS